MISGNNERRIADILRNGDDVLTSKEKRRTYDFIIKLRESHYELKCLVDELFVECGFKSKKRIKPGFINGFIVGMVVQSIFFIFLMIFQLTA